jgi:hypothetical protein
VVVRHSMWLRVVVVCWDASRVPAEGRTLIPGLARIFIALSFDLSLVLAMLHCSIVHRGGLAQNIML